MKIKDKKKDTAPAASDDKNKNEDTADCPKKTLREKFAARYLGRKNRARLVIFIILCTLCVAAIADIPVLIYLVQSEKIYDLVPSGISILKKEVPPPECEGYDFKVLTSVKSDSDFYASESQSVEYSSALTARQSAVTELAGITFGGGISLTPQDDVKLMRLSGDIEYDLYSFAGGDMSWLLANGCLEDISNSPYIDGAKEWYSSRVMDDLSINGKKFIIVGSMTDTLSAASVVIVNKAVLFDLENEVDYTLSLFDKVRTGEWTYSLFGRIIKDSYSAFNPYGQLEYAGLEADGGDTLAMIISQGQKFFTRADDGTLTANAHSGEYKTAFINSLSLITCDAAASGGLFENGKALFKIGRVSDYKSLRNTMSDLMFLPMPKAEKSARGYFSLLDLSSLEVLAIPRGCPRSDISEYIADRLNFLSQDTTAKYYDELYSDTLNITAADDGDETPTLTKTQQEMTTVISLLRQSETADLCDFFDFGNIKQTLSDLTYVGGEEKLEITMLSRSRLFEKALEIALSKSAQ